jgi:hypothetical protein
MCFKVKVKYSQTDDEIQAKFGAETVRRVAIRNHPYKDPSAYTHMLAVRAPRSYLGLLDNPVREELDAIARKVRMHAII